MRESIVFLDGRLLPASLARVSVRDASFRYGEGVFETLRARGGRVFRLERHLARLGAAAARIGWALPWSAGAIGRACREVLAANGYPETRLRVQASPGEGGPDGAAGPPVLVVDAEPFLPVETAQRERGVDLHVCPHPKARGATAGVKTTAYLEALLARRAARAQGCFEALRLAETGEVLEASTANLFAVLGGRLITPPLAAGVLPGITREAVLEIARVEGIPGAGEAPLRLDGLLGCQEVFLTSTAIDLLPVRAIDGRRLAPPPPGPLTRRLAAAYARLLDDEIGPVPR